MIVLCGRPDILAEEESEILCVLDRIPDGPAVVFVCTSGQSETLSEQRSFQRCVRSDVSISIVDFAGMIGFVAITVSEDEQRSVPNFRHSYPERRAVDLT